MIIGIEGSFRLEMGWQFPTHKDFKLLSFSDAKNMNMEEYDNVEAFVQTNILGYLKNNMKLVGTTSWAKGTLPGDVYLYDR